MQKQEKFTISEIKSYLRQYLPNISISYAMEGMTEDAILEANEKQETEAELELNNEDD